MNAFQNPLIRIIASIAVGLLLIFISERRSAYDSFNHRYSHRITQSIRSPRLSIERG